MKGNIMRSLVTGLFFIILFNLITINIDAYAQSSPVLYFCEEYTSDEINISDVFTTGWLTVMVKSSNPIGYSDVSIELHKYDQYADNFVFYKTIDFSITPSMDYVYFTDKENLKFTSPGFYRVKLTANNGNTVIASAIIRIIPG